MTIVVFPTNDRFNLSHFPVMMMKMRARLALLELASDSLSFLHTTYMQTSHFFLIWGHTYSS
jgi:hypothetical protein